MAERSHPRLLIAALVVLLAATAACTSPASRASGKPGAATVIHTVDGDTVEIQIEGHREKVRLLGIDTPETKDPRKPVQCFGPQAAARLAELLPPGTQVEVQRDAEARDRYGRLLLYLWRASDGLFVNLRLAQEGAADQLDIAPNSAHRAEIGDAVREARASRRGMWGACGGPGRPADDPAG